MSTVFSVFFFFTRWQKEIPETHVSSFISHVFREKNVKADETDKGNKSLQSRD